jgi:hypothetical protein
MPLTKLTSLGITDGTIVNADINASAAIAASKLSGAGKVLQIVQTTNATSITTSSTSFVTTGVSQSITPSSTSNKILISINGGGAYVGTGVSVTMRITVKRGATDLATLGVSDNGMMRFSTPGGSWVISPYSMMWLDSPSTTSSTTYEIFFRNSDTAGTVQFNGTDRGIVTLTLMEIAG